MKTVASFEIEDIRPEARLLLEQQGLSETAEPTPKAAAVVNRALEMFDQTASPRGVFLPVGATRFATIYDGDGKNADITPLAAIHPQAEHLALFAVTLGGRICSTIDRLFAERNFDLGTMLDAAATAGALRTADALQARFEEECRSAVPAENAIGVGRYSPGCCGWHVSGQRSLFAALKPEEIGILLRESFLMDPLKSIAGVMVSGEPAIHEFSEDYEFCEECRTHACRRRIHDILKDGTV